MTGFTQYVRLLHYNDPAHTFNTVTVLKFDRVSVLTHPSYFPDRGHLTGGDIMRGSGGVVLIILDRQSRDLGLIPCFSKPTFRFSFFQLHYF